MVAMTRSPVVSHPTVTQDVYDRLRADLLSCRLIPGDRLRIEVLCQRLSAGSSAVREALARLTSDGLVTMEPNRGFRVPSLSFAELRDITATRCQIEALCIRNALAHGDTDWEAEIVTALHRLSKTPERASGDPARFNDSFAINHTRFHRAVVAACDSPNLLQIREMLYFRQERYLWLSMPLAKVKRNLHDEHETIARLALARDVEGAVAAMTEHLRLTASIVLSSGIEGSVPDHAKPPSKRIA